MVSKESLARVNLLALKYFCMSLDKSKDAKSYLLGRIAQETVQKYWLGYAPKVGLIDYLNKYDVETEDALELGLIGLNDDDTAYEVFTRRIMFPIIKNSRVVGFGGRTLIDHPTKYLNSKSSLLYNKSETLYRLDIAKKSIYRKGCAILVEGYFDYLVAFENEVTNSVAGCGTAFKEGQARLLRRWTDTVYVCYDGDIAGKKAAKKAKKVLRKYNIFGGIINLPKGYDPDKFIKKFGSGKFTALND